MSQHPNARLTPLGRAELVARVGSGTPVAEAARQMGVSRQTASKWPSRARRDEPMSDRPCRPAKLAWSTPPADVERALEARRSMLLAPLALAAVTGVPALTCARIVARSGLPRLADVDRVTGEARRRGPVTPVRYERERPGELVYVDVKKVARIPDGGGHRALGRGCGSAAFAGELASRGDRPQVHEALQPLAERQGRADEPDTHPGVAVRPGVGERGRQVRGPGALPRALQLRAPAQRVRRTSADITHTRRKQRHGT